MGVVREKPCHDWSIWHLTRKEDLVGAKETKQRQPSKCVEESHNSAQHFFEIRPAEYAVKVGAQALRNAQSPSHMSIMEQTGLGSGCHRPSACEQFEFEAQANLETPRKRVPVGPEFQAELPQLVSVNKNHGFYAEMYEQDILRWRGEWIWPVQESESLFSGDVKSRIRSTVCSCAVRDSVQCVRLHVDEEREILRKELGKAFYAWGFDDMGEAATKHWTCKDKLTFHEIAKENPSSFWNELFAAFPSKQTWELVSYYFNVYVLQRRAIQNRIDSWDIDSDDDEMALDSEDEDSRSVVESDEEIDESNIDDAISANDEISYSVSHATEDFGDEQNTQCGSGTGDSSCVTETTPMQDKHDLPIESLKVSSTQFSWMAGLKDKQKQCFDGSESERNQGCKVWMKSWDTLDLEQQNRCDSNQKEGKLEVLKVACLVSGRQMSSDYSAHKEAFVVNSHPGALDQCDTKVWDNPSLLPSMDVDKLISTKGMMEEFFGGDS